MAHTESDLQFITSKFAETAKLLGLTISLSKTKVLHQAAPGSAAPFPSVHIKNALLEMVNGFKYMYLKASSQMALWTRKSLPESARPAKA